MTDPTTTTDPATRPVGYSRWVPTSSLVIRGLIRVIEMCLLAIFTIAVLWASIFAVTGWDLTGALLSFVFAVIGAHMIANRMVRAEKNRWV